MSTIVEQLAEAKAAIAALTSERDNLKASVEKLTGEKAAAEQSEKDAAKGKADAIALAEKTYSDLSAKLEVETKAKAEAEKAKSESDAELAKLKDAVASNPAFADAAAKGAKPVADVGAAEGSDLLKALEKITDPTERAKFRTTNYSAIMAQLRTTRKG